ncbi:PREDICTED: uncharacterized protein LOC100640713 isoform X2 [Amphimedon queenslandica]|uniref:Macro domain-containing protein n=1 Tax=Amphimedon queenslandica TaxID=400682 RepID=A0A1X7UDC9_AMPQE|nr:PREDICTED: uncharacterized protein LOC100640713 isoform X2 [Amphimedon queenslandica]|eukprot:XP_019854943.1 PREDICTED: uncharacterized protein LOC100640713 isoform X2 [Amphimedon queenslandica]
MADSKAEASSDVGFKIILRDYQRRMVQAWRDSKFGTEEKYKNLIEISEGDIFEGAPSVDAIVSPANSFGFMDGGIDMVYTVFFGWQMSERLKEVIKSEHNGELLVGNAIIIPAYSPDTDLESLKIDSSICEGKPIHYLISAPTMRVPTDVSDTMNSYLAFRAVLLAVMSHNKSCSQKGAEPIRSVMCPGLGTAVGRMPFVRCAEQMVAAYETVVSQSLVEFISPQSLMEPVIRHRHLITVGKDKALGSKPSPGEMFVPKNNRTEDSESD